MLVDPLGVLHHMAGTGLPSLPSGDKGAATVASVLDGVTDRDAGELSVTRTASSVALRAAGGQETRLFDDDADGYADRVEYAGAVGDVGSLPAASQWTWSADGLATSMLDPSGSLHSYGYDEAGLLESDQLASEPAQTLSQTSVETATPRGQEYVRTSPGGRATTLRVEATLDGTSTQRVTHADGTVQTSARDDAWQVTQSDALGSITQTLHADPVLGAGAAYAAHTELMLGTHSLVVDRDVIGEVDPTSTQLASWQSTTTLAPGTPDQAVSTRSWDGTTRTWTLTSPEGRVLEVELDAEGRAVSLRPAGLAETTLAYDAAGRLTSARRTEGVDVREAILGYDDAARALSVTGFEGDRHEQTYDARGHLASYTPPAVSGASAGTTSYEYDADGVPSALTLPGGSRVAITTDASGRPSSVALAAGTLALGYDPSTGQLTSASMPNAAGAQTLELSYDGPLLTRTSYSGAATADVDYEYDGVLRVSAVSVGGERTAYSYDRDGLVTRAGAETLTRDADTGLVVATRVGTVRQSYTTSGLLELTQHTATWPGGSFRETITARDGAGRIRDTTEATGAGTIGRGYAYDADGRVTEERQNSVRIASYVYDGQGNRTEVHRYNPATGTETESRTSSFDARDRLLQDSAATYTYDAAGRRATKTTTAGDVTRYAYDELGHLVRVELPTGMLVEYTYDALGRRTGRTTDGAVDGLSDTAWAYGAGPAPIAKLDGAGNLQVVYVYGTRSWVPDLIIVPDAAGVRSELAVVTDHRGSVRAMVETRTNAVIGPIDYDAFGRRGPTPAILAYYGFAFAGGTLDADTGLVHLGARDYDPETGTWIEPDPIRFGGGDTNLYAYVGGDPINRFDPSGLEWGLTGGLTVGISTINPFTSGGGWYYGINLQYVPGVGLRWYKVHADGRDAAGLNVGVSATCNIGRGEVGQPWEGHFDTEQVGAGPYTAGHYNSPYYYDDPGPYACPGCWAHHPRGYDGFELGVGAGLPVAVSVMDQEYSPWP